MSPWKSRALIAECEERRRTSWRRDTGAVGGGGMIGGGSFQRV